MCQFLPFNVLHEDIVFIRVILFVIAPTENALHIN